MCTLVTVRMTELGASTNLLNIIVLPCDGNGRGIRWTVEVVVIYSAKLPKEDLHQLRGLEREPCVDAIVSANCNSNHAKSSVCLASTALCVACCWHIERVCAWPGDYLNSESWREH